MLKLPANSLTFVLIALFSLAAPCVRAAEPPANTLSDAEKAAGWKLLFDGKSTDGWHTYGRNDVAPGWKVLDGALVCVNPRNAGDLTTNDKFDWFELSLDYNISAGGNSGVIFHSVDGPATTWQSGP